MENGHGLISLPSLHSGLRRGLFLSRLGPRTRPPSLSGWPGRLAHLPREPTSVLPLLPLTPRPRLAASSSTSRRRREYRVSSSSQPHCRSLALAERIRMRAQPWTPPKSLQTSCTPSLPSFPPRHAAVPGDSNVAPPWMRSGSSSPPAELWIRPNCCAPP
jgi:hypothetical protein